MNEAIIKDLGRKCGDDVAAAMRRTMLLADDRAGALAIAAYGAGHAFGALCGATAAVMGDEITLTPEFMDEVWAKFLRPIAVGEMSKEPAA